MPTPNALCCCEGVLFQVRLQRCAHEFRELPYVLAARLQVFRTRLDRLARRCAAHSIKLAFVDAPFALPLQPGQDVPTRTWFRRTPESQYSEDVASSLRVVADAWRTAGHPFCGMIAFSQGAAVVHEALLRADDVVPGCSAVLLAGGCLDARSSRTALTCKVASMHAMGAKDSAVPPAVSRELSPLFGDYACVLEHDQGHCVPGRAADLDRITDWLDANLALPPATRSLNASTNGTASAGPCVSGVDTSKLALSLQQQPLPWRASAGDERGGAASDEQPDEAHAELQHDELESLESIYDLELRVLSRQPVRISVPIPLPQALGGGAITAEFEMPPM